MKSIKKNPSKNLNRIAIIGGGASGVFAALRAAQVAKEKGKDVQVDVFESAPSFLRKVRISGGGRCNVTHHDMDRRRFVERYPRGSKALFAALHQFDAKDTIAWFEKKGVRLKVEADGRMFPTSNSSQTIIDCLLTKAKQLGVSMHHGARITMITKETPLCWKITRVGHTPFLVNAVLLATGSGPFGYKMLQNLEHNITERAPSLFTFNIKHPLLNGHAGLSFQNAIITLPAQLFEKTSTPKHRIQQGPLLITHRGLSGPAVLSLSAFAARHLKRATYQTLLSVNWIGINQTLVFDELTSIKNASPKKKLTKWAPLSLPKRFWHAVLHMHDIDDGSMWGELSKKNMRLISSTLTETQMNITGKNAFKEEFVECGGVDLKEVNFKTMESKLHKGLYFSGELLDVDGITGGFNFQNAWTTGWIAGSNMVKGLEG